MIVIQLLLFLKKSQNDPLKLTKAKEKFVISKKDYEDTNNEIKEQLNQVISQRVEVYDELIENLEEQMSIYHQSIADLIHGLRESKKEINRKYEEKKEKEAILNIPDEFNYDWFYLEGEDNAQIGPVTYLELKQLFSNKKIVAETNVCGGEMEGWSEIKAVKGLLEVLSKK